MVLCVFVSSKEYRQNSFLSKGKEAIFFELLDAVMGLNIDSSPKRRQTNRKKFLEQIFLANTCRKAVSGSCWDVVVLLVAYYLG